MNDATRAHREELEGHLAAEREGEVLAVAEPPGVLQIRVLRKATPHL